jgi:hypothetical protein
MKRSNQSGSWWTRLLRLYDKIERTWLRSEASTFEIRFINNYKLNNHKLNTLRQLKTSRKHHFISTSVRGLFAISSTFFSRFPSKINFLRFPAGYSMKTVMKAAAMRIKKFSFKSSCGGNLEDKFRVFRELQLDNEVWQSATRR